MNICHEGSQIVAFTVPWPSRNETPAEETERSDGEWLDYCREREFAERRAAKQARSIDAQRVHQELAQAYARVLQGRRYDR